MRDRPNGPPDSTGGWDATGGCLPACAMPLKKIFLTASARPPRPSLMPPPLPSSPMFAKHRIREGIPLCLAFLDLERWNKRSRIQQCLETLAEYGAAAKPVLPQLRQLEQDLPAHSEAKMLQAQIDQLRALIKNLETATGTVELRDLR
jgi:hypothetical protein